MTIMLTKEQIRSLRDWVEMDRSALGGDYEMMIPCKELGAVLDTAEAAIAMRIVLEEIESRCDNCLHAATLPISPAIHVAGLKGCAEAVRDMAGEALGRLEAD